MAPARSVLIVTSSYAASGEDAQSSAGLFVRDFADGLRRAGVRATVITQRKASLPGLDGDVIAYPWSGDSRPTVDLSLTRPGDLLQVLTLLQNGVRAIREACRRERPDRCLCMWATPAGVMARHALRRSGVPYDVWCLGSDIWRYGRSAATRWLVRRVLRDASMLFADGPGLVPEVRRLAGRPCRFLPSSRRLPNGQTAEQPLPKDCAQLLFVGRWHPNKGADLLPEAMALLKAQGVRAHLHLHGGGPLKGELAGLIQQHGVQDCITMYGYADEHVVASAMRACDLLLIPSRFETIPVVFSDAAQCGLPVVAAEVGDLGGIVRRYRAGETCPPDSPQALADAIRRALAIRRSDYAAGLAAARRAFDLDRAVARYLAWTS